MGPEAQTAAAAMPEAEQVAATQAAVVVRPGETVLVVNLSGLAAQAAG